MEGMRSERLRDLPSVDAVLKTAAASLLQKRYGRIASTNAVRAAIENSRAALKRGESDVPSAEELTTSARLLLSTEDRSGPRLLFNLTGTVLHTNLGRAVIAEAAIEAAVAAMRDPVALEFDLSVGGRGERDDHVRALLCALTGAEDATVVNNNAAARWLPRKAALAMASNPTTRPSNSRTKDHLLRRAGLSADQSEEVRRPLS
jgi:L-seryl-tRNA(Ser) seleniumtransferase